MDDKQLTIKVAQLIGWRVYWVKLNDAWYASDPSHNKIDVSEKHNPNLIWDILYEQKLPHFATDLNAIWEVFAENVFANPKVVSVPELSSITLWLQRNSAKEASRMLCEILVGILEPLVDNRPIIQASL